jgi:hypothetical protein
VHTYNVLKCMPHVLTHLSSGGSLTVQIFGSSPIRHSEDEERSENGDKLFVSDKQNGLSTSAVIVSSRKDVPARLKKPHNL